MRPAKVGAVFDLLTVRGLLKAEGQMWTSDAVDGIFVKFLKTCGRKTAIFGVAFAISFLPCPQVALAQAVYGSIFGTITDSTGAVVPNATVTVTDVAKGTTVNVQTGASGEYRVQHLIPDTYTVSIQATGFKTATTDNVIVYADTA